MEELEGWEATKYYIGCNKVDEDEAALLKKTRMTLIISGLEDELSGEKVTVGKEIAT